MASGSARRSQIARRINIALGAWLFISAFAWNHAAAERTNTWIVGVLCVVIAFSALSAPPARALNTVLAIWLFASVWALPHHSVATMWNNALVAVAVFFVSFVPDSGERPLGPARAPA